jgi:hypothetical protein
MGTRVLLVFISSRSAKHGSWDPRSNGYWQSLLPLPERAVVQADNGFVPAKVIPVQ